MNPNAAHSIQKHLLVPLLSARKPTGKQRQYIKNLTNKFDCTYLLQKLKRAIEKRKEEDRERREKKERIVEQNREEQKRECNRLLLKTQVLPLPFYTI